jgi:uncharacterized membrane protein YdfJ with MMPL/SSD domain
MAKVRLERYQKASDLAGDIERYLADEPVSAYREPWTGRLGRWVRRHRTAVVSASVALLLVAAGAVGGLWIWQQDRERRYREAFERLASGEAIRQILLPQL